MSVAKLWSSGKKWTSKELSKLKQLLLVFLFITGIAPLVNAGPPDPDGRRRVNKKRLLLSLLVAMIVLVVVAYGTGLTQTIGGSSKHHHSKHHHSKHHRHHSTPPSNFPSTPPSNPPSTPPSTPPSNNPPVANGDSYSIDEDQMKTVGASGVLANDSDPDGNSLKATLVTNPANGTATLNSDGSFSYTPKKDFNGTDSFTYKDNDGTTDSSAATVTITVNPVNDAPVANDGTETMNEDDSQLQIDFGALVSDTETSDANLTYNIVSGPTSSQGTLSSSGSTRTFTPAKDYNGTIYITYTVTDRGDPDNCGTPSTSCDAAKTSDQKTVTVTVNPVNDTPVATDGAETMNEDGTPITIDFGALVSDKETSNSNLTYNITDPDPAKGSLTGTGSTRTFTPAADYNGTVQIAYTVTDRGDPDNCGTASASCAAAETSDQKTVTVTVNSVNDAPVGTDNTVTTPEDTAYTFAKSDFGFSDPNDTPPNALTAVEITTLPSAGTLTDNNTAVTAGQFILVADIEGGKLKFAPGSNANGSGYASFTFQVQDDGGTANGGVDLDQSPNTITVNVTPVNDAPSFTKGSDQNNVANQDNNGNPKAYTVNPWATGISAGPSDEQSNQTVNFVIDSITYAATTCGTPTNLFTVTGAPAVSSSGVLTFTTEPSQCGTATVTLHIHDNGGTDNGGVDESATQTFTITTVVPAPDAVDDPSAGNTADYSANGGIPIDIPASIGVLQNDAVRGGHIDGYGKPTGTEQTTLATATPTAQGGLVTLNSDGSFRYEPPPSPPSGGTDTFKYRLSNNGGSDTATVTISVTDQAFFVDDSALAGGNGTLLHPFNSPSDVPGTRGNNGLVFLFSGSYSDGITLKSGEYLIGQGVDVGNNLPFALKPRSIALPSKDTSPTLAASTANANAVTLDSNNNVKGLNLGDTSGGSDISGTNFGTLTVGTVGINTNGQALSLNNGTLSGSGFTQLSSTGGANNVSLTSVGTSGTPALGTSSDALSGASSDAFKINGGGGSFTYAGKISNTSTLAVNVTSKTGGTVTFSGDINPTTAGKGISVSENKTGTNTITFSGANKKISTGSGTGVSLSNNTGATINFTNGGLAVTGTSNAAGFSATGGGTVNVQGSNNTIGTDTGTALNVANNTNIGSSGLTFKSISAGNNSNGPTNGIVLNNTGTSGGLTVTGGGNASVGGDSSGGTIQHTSNYGISLTSTLSPSFTNMNIHDTGHNGIDGTDVTNFTFANGQISNTGTAAAGQNEENSIAFEDKASPFTDNTLDGTVSITGSSISQPHRNGIAIETYNGTISSLNISNNTFCGGMTSGGLTTCNTTTIASHGSTGSSSDVQDAVHVFSQGSASTTGNITTGAIKNNTISEFRFFDTTTNKFVGGNGIRLAGGNTAASTSATIGTSGNPIVISGNTISNLGSNGVATSFSGQQGISHVEVKNNPISHVEGLGISVFFGGNNNPRGENFTGLVSGNTVNGTSETVQAGSNGIGVQSDNGTSTSDVTNSSFTVSNNTVSNENGNGIIATGINNSGTMNTRIIDNNVTTVPVLTARYGIRVQHSSAAPEPTINLEIHGNSTAGGSGITNNGIGLRKQNPFTFCIEGLTPSPTDDPSAYVNSQNPNGHGTDVINGTGFTNCNVPDTP